MKMKKLVIGLLSLSLLLTACSGKDKKVASIDGVDLSKYPIETDVELTYFKNLPANISSLFENYGDTEFAKEYDKRTGVKINYTHPAAGQESEKLNLMIASGKLPDVIEAAWSGYSGGPQKAINEKVILPLNDYKEYAPALFKVFEENPEYDRASKTDNGQYYGFTLINDGARLRLATGPAVRKDLLRKYDLEEPETVEDWEKMLTVFKENGMNAPFSFNYDNIYVLFNMFGASFDPYVRNGEVVYGPAEPEFKKALEILHDWFNKGLLDNNIVSVDNALITSQILNGQTGAALVSGGGGIGQLMAAAPNDEFDFAGVVYPTFEKGKINTTLPLMSPITGNGTAAITTQCKYPELAAKVLDYLYTDEGHFFANFGIEGVAHTIVDGQPKYTDLIMKNSDGYTVSQALGKYVKAGNGAAFIQDERYIEQYYALPQQQAALDNWLKGADSMDESFQPIPPLSPTPEEAAEYANYMTEINKYRGQMIIKFITGIEPISKFDEYVETLKKYGMDKAMKIQTDAYKRYISR